MGFLRADRSDRRCSEPTSLHGYVAHRARLRNRKARATRVERLGERAAKAALPEKGFISFYLHRLLLTGARLDLPEDVLHLLEHLLAHQPGERAARPASG